MKKNKIRKQKTRKMSIKAKIMTTSWIIIIIIALMLGMNSYVQLNKGMVSMGVELSDMASTLAVSSVDTDLLDVIMFGGEANTEYQKQIKVLNSVQNKTGIKHLYTLYTENEKVYYGLDTATVNHKELGTEYDKDYEYLKDVFNGKELTQDYIESSEGNKYITAYKPIFDSDNNVVAVLGADYDASGVVDKLNELLIRIIIITVVASTIAIIIIGYVVSKSTKSLLIVNQKVYDLVYNKGDLTQKLNINTGDETELIANNINLLLEHIREVIISISDNSQTLNESSKLVVENLSSTQMNVTDVSATMQQMSAAMQETSASLTRINEAVYNINEAIDNISEAATDGSETSNTVREKAISIYQNAVSEQTDAKNLAHIMEQNLTEQIEKSKEVERISELTTEILNITSQTNMLALNASIEAARAGDAGKGFAVVAQEIGRLAQNSAKAAEQIRSVSNAVIETVNNLAKESESMLHFMNITAMTGYDELLVTSENYQNSMNQINTMMNDFATECMALKNNMGEIKSAIDSVNTALEDSSKGVQNVTQMSVEITAKVNEIENEANANMDISNQLNNEVNKFTF